jgi:hypothetical protein
MLRLQRHELTDLPKKDKLAMCRGFGHRYAKMGPKLTAAERAVHLVASRPLPEGYELRLRVLS